MHQVGFIYKIFWDVTYFRFFVVPSSSGSTSSGRMGFSLTAWPKVNAIWTFETSVNTHQLVKRKIPEELRIFCNTAVTAANCYIFSNTFFTWMSVQSVAHCNSQYVAGLCYSRILLLLFYGTWESVRNTWSERATTCWVRMEVTVTWVWGVHRL